MTQAANGPALNQPHGARIVIGPDGFGAVLFHGVLEFFGQKVQCRVPRQRLKLTTAFGADASQRLRQAGRVVHPFGIAGHLGANHAIGVRLRGTSHAPHGAIGMTFHFQRANAGAVMGANAVKVLRGHLGLSLRMKTHDRMYLS